MMQRLVLELGFKSSFATLQRLDFEVYYFVSSNYFIWKILQESLSAK